MVAALTQHIPTQSANATDEWYIACPFPGTWRIREVKFAPATAVAVDGTDYITITVGTNASDASTSWTDIGSWNTNTGGTAHVIGTTISPSLSAVPTALEISEGRQIRIEKELAGAGKILDGTFTIQLEKLA